MVVVWLLFHCNECGIIYRSYPQVVGFTFRWVGCMLANEMKTVSIGRVGLCPLGNEGRNLALYGQFISD